MDFKQGEREITIRGDPTLAREVVAPEAVTLVWSLRPIEVPSEEAKKQGLTEERNNWKRYWRGTRKCFRNHKGCLLTVTGCIGYEGRGWPKKRSPVQVPQSVERRDKEASGGNVENRDHPT